MTRKMKLMGLVLVLTLMFSSLSFASDTLAGASAAKMDSQYTLEEMLRYALEDEMLAQAEYEAIMEEFDVDRPFSNIYKAEISHENAIIALYEAKEIEVPSFDPSGYLYIPESLTEIYEIGVKAEIENIAMYDKFLEGDLDDDVRTVFEALRDASKNHLEAFEWSLERETSPNLGQSNSYGNTNKGQRGKNRSNSSGFQGSNNSQVNQSRGFNMTNEPRLRNSNECILNK